MATMTRKVTRAELTTTQVRDLGNPGETSRPYSSSVEIGSRYLNNVCGIEPWDSRGWVCLRPQGMSRVGGYSHTPTHTMAQNALTICMQICGP